VATVLFGATSPEQVTENARALDVLGRLDDARLRELEQIGGEDA
jgi:aryl-alcohol dehydrogenase-like predicted oxidoreductase